MRLWLLFGVAWLASGIAAAAPFRVDPKLPAWVVPREVPPPPQSLLERQRPDVLRLLYDTQDRVDGKGGLERYLHLAHQVTSAAGVQRESELAMDFDPAFETLRVHYVRVHRDGVARNALRRDTLRVVQQEEELERRILNGRVSVMAFLDDVRVGDVIDFAYSVRGQNPAMAEHYDDAFALADSEPVALRRHRLLYPSAARPLSVRGYGGAPEPRRGQVGADLELEWELRDAVAPPVDEDTPDWFSAGPWVQLSDFASWPEVAQWALRLYHPDARANAVMRELVERTRKASADPTALVASLLAFVQDDVRYLGMELGPGALAPRPPAAVFSRRFGDCKDKALLFAVLLRAAGLDASPALVSTLWRRELDRLLPGAIVFDHVITRVRLGEQTYWLDGTADHQRGKLTERPPPDLERALVLAGDTVGLSVIPLPALTRPEVEVDEEYSVAAEGAPADLRVVTTYRGDAADEMRRRVASSPRSDLQEEFRKFYAEHDGEITVASPLAVSDDADGNLVRTVETYVLEEFWRDAQHTFEPWVVTGQLVAPPGKSRRTPFAVEYPAYVRHRMVVHLPEPYEIERADKTVRTPALEVAARAELRGQTLELDYSLRSLKDHVLPSELEVHVRRVDEARQLTAFRIETHRPTQPLSFGLVPAVGLALVFVGSLAAAPLWRRTSLAVDGRRARRYRRLGVFSEGHAPETALEARSLDQAASRVRKLRCGCGKRFGGAVAAPSDVTFGGRRLWAYPVTCSSCGSPSTLYVAPRPS